MINKYWPRNYLWIFFYQVSFHLKKNFKNKIWFDSIKQTEVAMGWPRKKDINILVQANSEKFAPTWNRTYNYKKLYPNTSFLPNWKIEKNIRVKCALTCILSITPLERGPDRVSGYLNEIDGVVSVACERVLSLAPRDKPIHHAYFFALWKGFLREYKECTWARRAFLSNYIKCFQMHCRYF